MPGLLLARPRKGRWGKGPFTSTYMETSRSGGGCEPAGSGRMLSGRGWPAPLPTFPRDPVSPGRLLSTRIVHVSHTYCTHIAHISHMYHTRIAHTPPGTHGSGAAPRQTEPGSAAGSFPAPASVTLTPHHVFNGLFAHSSLGRGNISLIREQPAARSSRQPGPGKDLMAGLFSVLPPQPALRTSTPRRLWLTQCRAAGLRASGAGDCGSAGHSS